MPYLYVGDTNALYTADSCIHCPFSFEVRKMQQNVAGLRGSIGSAHPIFKSLSVVSACVCAPPQVQHQRDAADHCYNEPGAARAANPAARVSARQRHHVQRRRVHLPHVGVCAQPHMVNHPSIQSNLLAPQPFPCKLGQQCTMQDNHSATLCFRAERV
jgi:hypothetical protein